MVGMAINQDDVCVWVHLVERSADVAVVVNVHATVQPQHCIPNRGQ